MPIKAIVKRNITGRRSLIVLPLRVLHVALTASMAGLGDSAFKRRSSSPWPDSVGHQSHDQAAYGT